MDNYFDFGDINDTITSEFEELLAEYGSHPFWCDTFALLLQMLDIEDGNGLSETVKYLNSNNNVVKDWLFSACSQLKLNKRKALSVIFYDLIKKTLNGDGSLYGDILKYVIEYNCLDSFEDAIEKAVVELSSDVFTIKRLFSMFRDVSVLFGISSVSALDNEKTASRLKNLFLQYYDVKTTDSRSILNEWYYETNTQDKLIALAESILPYDDLECYPTFLNVRCCISGLQSKCLKLFDDPCKLNVENFCVDTVNENGNKNYNGLVIINGNVCEEAFDKERNIYVAYLSNTDSIGCDAFSHCYNLKKVAINDSCSDIGDNAFTDCTKLEFISLPNGLKTIGKQTFASSGIKSLVLPSGISKIPCGCFANCKQLTSLKAKGHLDSIGYRAFAWCKSLKQIELPDVTIIGDSAFAACKSINRIELPPNVLSIGIGAFADCTELEQITISNSITEIPYNFAIGCSNLKKVIFGNNVMRIMDNAFYLCNNFKYVTFPTNILFFDNSGATKETWFYRLDMPEGYKNFSKTKPMRIEHFDPAVEWWNNRQEISVDGFDKAKKYTVDEIIARNYNIDLCGYPHEEEGILPPKELIQQYQEKRASLNADIDRILAQITDILGIDLSEGEDK